MDRGNINIPKMTSGVSASYVGELRKAKASKAKFGNVRPFIVCRSGHAGIQRMDRVGHPVEIEGFVQC